MIIFHYMPFVKDMTKIYFILSFLRVFRAFSNVSAFSTKVENADMNKKFLFYRFYAFSGHE